MKKWQIHQPSEEAAKQIRGPAAICPCCNAGSGGTRYA